MSTLASRLKKAREALRPVVTQHAAAKHFGVTRSTVNQWEKGRIKPNEDRHAVIAEFYHLTLDELESDNTHDKPQVIKQQRLQAGGPVDLPVYSSSEIEGGVWKADPSMVLLELARDTTRYSTSAFGVYCHGNQQSPAFEPRDMIIIEPGRPVAPGDDVVLVQGYQHGEKRPFQGILRRLLGWTETHWNIRQFNPPRDYDVSKDEWPAALWVSGKHSR